MATNPMLPPVKVDPISGKLVPQNMPPPSAAAIGLGFQGWAAHPDNAAKVQASMVSPEAPLQPNAGQPGAPAGMASSNPPPVAPMASAMPPGGFGAARAAAQPMGAEPSGSINLPAAPAPAMASARPPVQSQAGADMQRLQTLQTEGAGLNKIGNPWLRGLARAGDIAGTILAPGVMSAVPGTTVHNWTLQNMQQNRVASDQAALQADQQSQLTNLDMQAKQQAMAGTTKATAKAAMEGTIVRGGDGKPIAWVDDDGVTHASGDAAIPEGVAAVMSTDTGKPATSEFELWHQQNPAGTAADFDKLKSKPLSAEQATSLNAVWNPIAAKHHLPSGQFQPGMSTADATALSGALNNAIGKAQGDVRITIDQQGLAAKGPLDTSDPAMQAAVAGVANGSMKLQDVFGRGATTAQKAQFAAAVKQVNPNFNSGDNAVENASRQYMISGQGGQTLTAGNTLSHHLDLYDKAVDAVKNGDLKLMNQIGNELGIQTGNDAQTNLSLIRQGVAMEAARYWTGGVPGEGEINQFNKSLSGDGSPAQMHGGANTIRAMAQGKLKGLQGQSEAGSRGQANFINPMAPPTTGKADYVYVPGQGLVKQ